jgi:plastocyanin
MLDRCVTRRSSRRIGSVALTLLALCAGLALSPVARAASPPEQHVTIDHFAFTPSTLSIPVGTTVIWSNQDGTLHTVTSSTQAFTSGGLDQGAGFSHTFSAPGTFAYYCKLHPSMTGTITVK